LPKTKQKEASGDAKVEMNWRLLNLKSERNFWDRRLLQRQEKSSIS